MCFNEADGKFLWQAVHDKLPAGRVNDWPGEGICSSPVVEGRSVVLRQQPLRGHLRRCQRHGQRQPRCHRRELQGRTDVDIIWRLDMIGELGVFPHNLAICSPLIVGDTLFVITANGVDEGHINIPRPDAPSFMAIDKKTGKVLVEGQRRRAAVSSSGARAAQRWTSRSWSIRPAADARPMVQPRLRRSQRQADDYLPRRRRLDSRLQPQGRQIAVEVRLQPQGHRSTNWAAKARATISFRTPVIWENKLYIGVGQDPEHNKGVGHLWCIDITKEPKTRRQGFDADQTTTSIPRPRSTRTPAWSGTTAAQPRRRTTAITSLAAR